MCMISYIHDSTSVSSTTSMTVPVPDLQHQWLYLCQIYNIHDCTYLCLINNILRNLVLKDSTQVQIGWEKWKRSKKKLLKCHPPPKKKYQKKKLHKNKQIIYNFSLLMRSIHEFIDLWEYIDLIVILGLIIDWSQKTSIVWL